MNNLIRGDKIIQLGWINRYYNILSPFFYFDYDNLMKVFVCSCHRTWGEVLFSLALVRSVPVLANINRGDKVIQLSCTYRFYIILCPLHYLDKENLIKMFVCYCEPPWRALLFWPALVTEVPGFTNRNTGYKIIQVACIYRFYIILPTHHHFKQENWRK